MITVMTQKEYESIMHRRTIEDSDMVIVLSKDGTVWVKKNSYGNTKQIAPFEIAKLVMAYADLSL